VRNNITSEATTSAQGCRRDGDTDRRQADKPVFIQLSPEQVVQVTRAASDTGTLSALYSGLGGPAALQARLQAWTGSRLPTSLTQALLVLASFPADGSYLSLVDLAGICDFNRSTTHHYVCAFLAAGILERDPRTREYRLAA
jgi:hypothetical protein